jgi:hypothetical protein
MAFSGSFGLFCALFCALGMYVMVIGIKSKIEVMVEVLSSIYNEEVIFERRFREWEPGQVEVLINRNGNPTSSMAAQILPKYSLIDHKDGGFHYEVKQDLPGYPPRSPLIACDVFAEAAAITAFQREQDQVWIAQLLILPGRQTSQGAVFDGMRGQPETLALRTHIATLDPNGFITLGKVCSHPDLQLRYLLGMLARMVRNRDERG